MPVPSTYPTCGFWPAGTAADAAGTAEAAGTEAAAAAGAAPHNNSDKPVSIRLPSYQFSRTFPLGPQRCAIVAYSKKSTLFYSVDSVLRAVSHLPYQRTLRRKLRLTVLPQQTPEYAYAYVMQHGRYDVEIATPDICQKYVEAYISQLSDGLPHESNALEAHCRRMIVLLGAQSSQVRRGRFCFIGLTCIVRVVSSAAILELPIPLDCDHN